MHCCRIEHIILFFLYAFRFLTLLYFIPFWPQLSSILFSLVFLSLFDSFVVLLCCVFCFSFFIFVSFLRVMFPFSSVCVLFRYENEHWFLTYAEIERFFFFEIRSLLCYGVFHSLRSFHRIFLKPRLQPVFMKKTFSPSSSPASYSDLRLRGTSLLEHVFRL